MSDLKYTTDGKKVKVIGNLNPEEKIVQEIFITEGGQEIPSGENFVVRSLHDAPVVSWEERQIEKIKKNYEDQKDKYEEHIDDLEKSYRGSKILLKEKISLARETIPNIVKESFDTAVDFLEGNFKYIVYKCYGAPEIFTLEEFEDKLLDKDKSFGGFRLLTLFGKVDGDMQWKMSEYTQGSGGSYSIFPYKTFDEAKAKSMELLDDKVYDEDVIKFLNKHNIELNKEKLKEFKNRRLNQIKESIEEHRKDIKELESESESI